MKKKIICCCVIAVLLICFLPFPQSIERTFHGIDISSGEAVSIDLDMKYLKFLFLDDKMYGDIAVICGDETTVYGESMHYSGLYPANNEDEEVHAFFGWYFSDDRITYTDKFGNNTSNIAGFEVASAFLSRDFSKILLYHKEDGRKENARIHQYIGTVEEDKTEAALEYFKDYIKMFQQLH